jgi:CPA2 family monovalent cation:H+ antiporter-2
MGVDLGILPEAGRDLILAGALISIILNPLAFWLADRLLPRLERPVLAAPSAAPGLPEPPPVPANEAEPSLSAASSPPPPPAGHTVLVGYGRVGMAIAETLLQDKVAFVVVEAADDRIALARKLGLRVIGANAATTEALVAAGIEAAATLFVAIPNAFEAGQAVEQARRLTPGLYIIARAHSDEEAEYLRQLGADHVIMGEREIGLGMVEKSKRDQ